MAANPPLRRTLWRLGLLSALVYGVAYPLPYWLPAYFQNVKDEIYQFAARELWRGVWFYLALAALFVCYLLAYRQVRDAPLDSGAARRILLWTGVFCLLLIPSQPITSSDVYGYVFQGRIVAVLGENPFAHLYNEFAGDPFYYLVTFHDLPATTGYGPLWVAVEAALGWLARDRLLLNLLLFKGLAAGFHLLNAWLVYATLQRLAPRHSLGGLLFYAWNPLLLHELVANAHNDAAVAALVLLGFYLLSRSRLIQSPRLDRPGWGLLAIPCLAAAALVKPVAVLWLPLVAVWLLAQSPGWAARLRQAGAMAVLAALPAVAAYAPFWAGAATLRGVWAQSDIHGNSLPNLLVWVLWDFWPQAGAQIVQGVKLLTGLVFAPFYLWQLWLARREPIHAAFDVMLFYLLFVGFQFMPWYVTWLMIPAALLADSLRRRVALALSVAAPLLYFPFGWQWATAHLPNWGVALFAAAPLLGLGLWLGIRRGWDRPAG
jgi:hypothetical protein